MGAVSEIWKELVVFLPQWEQAAWVILASSSGVQVWKLWRKHKHQKPRGYVIAAVGMMVATALGILTIWADTRDATLAVSGGLKVGLAAPALWWIAIAVARQYFPWLATAIGEDRRKDYRAGGPWAHSRRELFDDTEEQCVEEIRQAIEEATERNRNV
jgi:hypothetical protein